MFGLGPTELIVILVIALLVLGPKRLPELAAGLGKGLAEFRRATADINAELDEARRSLEEQTREAARATQAGRVSRTARVEPKPSAAEPAEEAEVAEEQPVEHAAAPHQASTPKAPA